MGSSSSKQESDGIKAVGTESSSTKNGGFHLVEIVNEIVQVGIAVVVIHMLAKVINKIVYCILQ